MYISLTQEYWDKFVKKNNVSPHTSPAVKGQMTYGVHQIKATVSDRGPGFSVAGAFFHLDGGRLNFKYDNSILYTRKVFTQEAGLL